MTHSEMSDFIAESPNDAGIRFPSHEYSIPSKTQPAYADSPSPCPCPSTAKWRKSPMMEEYLLCMGIWSWALLYSAYCFYQTSQRLLPRYLDYSDVHRVDWLSDLEGIDLHRDHGDTEWTFWKISIVKVFTLQSLRVAVRHGVAGRWSSTFGTVNPAINRLIVLAADMACCWCLIGLPGLLYHLLLTGLFFVVGLSKRKILVWALAFFIELGRYFVPVEQYLIVGDGIFDRYLLGMTTYYLLLRSISFACDYSDQPLGTTVGTEEQLLEQFVLVLEYQFFLPLYFLGPHLDYNAFCLKNAPSGRAIDWRFAVRIGVSVVAAVLMVEFFSLFLYPFSARYDREMLERMSLWSLAGCGYVLGQFFQLKYIALFGMFGFFSILNGINWSPLPVCVAWVHRYSLMWQHFDHGLYVFLKRNLHIPLIRTRIPFTHISISPVLSSFACYAFVFNWHARHNHIAIWVGTNWITLLLEKIIYSKVQDERLRALLNAPVLIASMVSNMCFLGDSTNFGWQLLKRILLGNTLINVLGVLIFFYSASFGGALLQQWKYPKVQRARNIHVS
ncbi:putative Protein-cysteine N-palmitoyltransferase HHAT [Hypsibius exemplaris]|uniref:Protein-cysteine N-palmitoyltransferase HHAT n=1 Tax=Hypsibius exemplaris TaxID=2072580 RepID=A0A1W0X414_HYPEX|nr:putative Protein-cysteine N-palmitoyltransferase HHAT [Hypsibius exemplaris]